jgi:hypothetical protein
VTLTPLSCIWTALRESEILSEEVLSTMTSIRSPTCMQHNREAFTCCSGLGGCADVDHITRRITGCKLHTGTSAM